MREDIVQVLKGLEDARGKLHAEEVVDAARPTASPLHHLFTWDDAVAAAERRLDEARQLIRSYKVAVVSEPARAGQRAVMTRQYVADRTIGLSSPVGTYTAVSALTRPQRDLLLLRVRREVRSLAERYGHLSEFWDEVAIVVAEHEARGK